MFPYPNLNQWTWLSNINKTQMYNCVVSINVVLYEQYQYLIQWLQFLADNREIVSFRLQPKMPTLVQ